MLVGFVGLQVLGNNLMFKLDYSGLRIRKVNNSIQHRGNASLHTLERGCDCIFTFLLIFNF